MGWTFGSDSKDALLAERIKDSTSGDKIHKCLAHCYRGGRSGGVLWTVWVITNTEAKWVLDSYIGCDLIRRHGNEWGYKDMEESSGPYYYSCPLKYLNMVPMPKGKHAPEWREKVRAYHAVHNRKLTKGATYEATPGLRLGDRGKITHIRADSLRPIRGTVTFESGLVLGNVRFKRKMVAEEVTV